VRRKSSAGSATQLKSPIRTVLRVTSCPRVRKKSARLPTLEIWDAETLTNFEPRSTLEPDGEGGDASVAALSEGDFCGQERVSDEDCGAAPTRLLADWSDVRPKAMDGRGVCKVPDIRASFSSWNPTMSAFFAVLMACSHVPFESAPRILADRTLRSGPSPSRPEGGRGCDFLSDMP